MNKDNGSKGGGIGFTGVLTILFIALKLTGNIKRVKRRNDLLTV